MTRALRARRQVLPFRFRPVSVWPAAVPNGRGESEGPVVVTRSVTVGLLHVISRSQTHRIGRLARERRGLNLALQRPGVERVEALAREPFTERTRLVFPARRQSVVVGFAVRRLPVTDQEDGAHASRMYPT